MELIKFEEHSYKIKYVEEEVLKEFHGVGLQNEIVGIDAIKSLYFIETIAYPAFVCDRDLTEQEQTNLLILCQNHIFLNGYKEEKIEFMSKLSFVERDKILPDYKLINAGLGIYSSEIKTQYLNTVEAFRVEFYRLKGLIEVAISKEEIDSLVPSFPVALIS